MSIDVKLVENVVLRFISRDDTDLIVKWRNSDSVRQHLFKRELINRKIHEEWLRQQVDTGQCVQFIIVIENENRESIPIGSTFLKNIDRTNRSAEFGMFIGEAAARGKGYGSQSAQLTIKYGFDMLSLQNIYLYVFSDNISALRVYEKMGFVVEAVIKDTYFDGCQCNDILRMVISRESENSGGCSC